jgi:hypothetical protein
MRTAFENPVFFRAKKKELRFSFVAKKETATISGSRRIV